MPEDIAALVTVIVDQAMDASVHFVLPSNALCPKIRQGALSWHHSTGSTQSAHVSTVVRSWALEITTMLAVSAMVDVGQLLVVNANLAMT